MKSKVDKSDVDKLVTVDLSKLNDVAKIEVVKSTEYNELLRKTH